MKDFEYKIEFGTLYTFAENGIALDGYIQEYISHGGKREDIKVTIVQEQTRKWISLKPK